jgi:Ca-activated chloride channel family protein
MLRFAHTDYLWGLILIPILLLFFIFITRWKKKALASFGDKAIVRLMMPEVSFSKPWLKFTLFLIGYIALIFAAADPQVGSKMEEVKRKGTDVMILLDVSNSMLSQDLSPNRLENAKQAISQLVDNLHDDRIGIVVFAGQAYVQLPMTTDYSAAKLFLNTINTAMVPTQGTAIGAAIDMGIKSLDFKNGMSKSMIVITDGENHEDDAVSAASSAKSKGVVVHVIGVGSSEGSPIPIYVNGKQSGFHTDSAGKVVMSKLDENMGKEIAAAGDGVYVRATNANSGLNIVMDQIAKMERKAYDSKSFKDFEDRFQVFIGLALALFVLEFFISNRKSLRLSKLKLFEVKEKPQL